jgi:hypothetical protein
MTLGNYIYAFPTSIEGRYYLRAVTVSGTQADYYSVPGTMPCAICGDIGAGSKELISDAYPNPTTGTIQITYDIATNGMLELYTIEGNIVKAVELRSNEKSISISTQDLAPSMYYYSIKVNGRETQPKKFIKL